MARSIDEITAKITASAGLDSWAEQEMVAVPCCQRAG